MKNINANHEMINEQFWTSLDLETPKVTNMSEVNGRHMLIFKLRFGLSVFLRCRPARIQSVEARTASWNKSQTNGCHGHHWSKVFSPRFSTVSWKHILLSSFQDLLWYYVTLLPRSESSWHAHPRWCLMIGSLQLGICVTNIYGRICTDMTKVFFWSSFIYIFSLLHPFLYD